MEEIKVEVACAGLSEVKTAVEAGADRIEINSALSLGGITASLGLYRETFRVAKNSARDVVVLPMLRPRSGDFCYDADDFITMIADARILACEGIKGLVFGITLENGSIDKKRCKEIINITLEAHSEFCNRQHIANELQSLEFIFHRAFDSTPSYKESLDILIELGFKRVLSSGHGCQNADAGKTMLAQMMEYAGGRIEILPGGGVRQSNVAEILAVSGCNQAHFSLKKNDSEFFSVKETSSLIGKIKALA